MAALPLQNWSQQNRPQQNRYLWVQFVGLAAVPLLLDICLAGLASARTTFGYPSAFGLQYWLVAAVCIVPPLLMQCLRPFYVFSLPPLALKPSVLTTNQRRCLRLLESWQIKALAMGSAGLSLWLLSQLYERSPQITPVMTPNAGLLAAVVAFFWVCVFLQISISSARLLLVGPDAMKRVKPYEPPAIAANFSILGLRVGKILPVPFDKVSTEPATERAAESESFDDRDTELQDAKDDIVETELIEPEITASELELSEPELSEPEPEPEPTESALPEQTAIDAAPLEPQPEVELPIAPEAELPTEEKWVEPSVSTAMEPSVEGSADGIESDDTETE